jgi:Glycogen debranching enzyme
MMGESSFIDWREQSYPRWMQPADIYQSECIGTNAVHYQALNVFSHIAKLLGQAEVCQQYEQKALALKEAINKNLWMVDKGYYAQYLYGRNNYIKSPKSESLGEALAVLFDIASPEQAKQVTENNPVVPFGAPIFYPQIADMPPYHNNAVWPFVSSYWMHASAKGGNEAGVMQAIGSILSCCSFVLHQ